MKSFLINIFFINCQKCIIYVRNYITTSENNKYFPPKIIRHILHSSTNTQRLLSKRGKYRSYLFSKKRDSAEAME